MALVEFKKGLESDLPAQSQDGTIYYTTDTHKMIFGNSAGDYDLLTGICEPITNDEIDALGSTT